MQPKTTSTAPQARPAAPAPWRSNLNEANRHLARWVPAARAPIPEARTPAGQCFRRVNEILSRVPTRAAERRGK